MYVLRTLPLMLLVLAACAPAAAQDRLIGLLRTPTHFGMMRHSTAPGMDDPPEFRIGDCATQRNLSEGGRAQARAIGKRLRGAGLTDVRLVSSQWCRTGDTARLMDIGTVEELPSLNSLVSYPGQSRQMTDDLRRWILKQDLSRPTILVTHQVNIGALVGAYPDEGDIVVVQRAAGGELRVVGTITAN